LNTRNANLYSASSGTAVHAGLKPRMPRIQVKVPATAILFPNRHLPIILKNISVTGFGASCAGGMPINAQILLDVQDLGRFPAMVRWSFGDSFGARFNGRLDTAQKVLIVGLVRATRALAQAGRSSAPVTQPGDISSVSIIGTLSSVGCHDLLPSASGLPRDHA
jgi:hypothetical protein